MFVDLTLTFTHEQEKLNIVKIDTTSTILIE